MLEKVYYLHVGLSISSSNTLAINGLADDVISILK
jgi:hypothetical protein